MRVLVTGAAGQLGCDVRRAFAGDDVVALGRAELDVTSEPAVVAAVRDARPELVVHTAAWTKVDACETDPRTAMAVNAAGAWWVARACDLAGAAMVYLSSDYVFDGTAGRPYDEGDATNPQSVYGRSKLAGERLVRETLARHTIVRTSWVHGRDGANFVRTMLRLGRERGAVSVVDDQTGSPTFGADLAPALRTLAVSRRYGTFHLTNAGHCTWFELARTAFAVAGIAVDVAPTDTATFGAPAPRPAYSVLDNGLAHLAGVTPLPHWSDALERLLADWS